MESVNKIYIALQTLTKNKSRPRSRQSWSRSLAPDTPSIQTPEEQVFFDKPPTPLVPKEQEGGDTVDSHQQAVEAAFRDDDQEPPASYSRPVSRGWRRDHEGVVLRYAEHRPTVGGARLPSSALDRIFDQSGRRQYGMGWFGRVFG